MQNKKFWDTVKPFLTSKGFKHNENMTINIDNKTATDPSTNIINNSLSINSFSNSAICASARTVIKKNDRRHIQNTALSAL